MIWAGLLLFSIFPSDVAIADELSAPTYRHGIHGEQADAAFRDAVEDGSRLEVPPELNPVDMDKCSGEILTHIKSKDYSFISPSQHFDEWESKENKVKFSCRSSDIELNESWVFPRGVRQDDFEEKDWDKIGAAHYIADRSVDVYKIQASGDLSKTYLLTIGSGLLSHLDKSKWFSDDLFKIIIKKKNRCSEWISEPTLGAVGVVSINGKPFLFNVTKAPPYIGSEHNFSFEKSVYILNITERHPSQCVYMVKGEVR
jgi:hypothetical protein